MSNILLFLSFIITILGIATLNIILLVLIYNFITNRKNNDKLIIISTILSIIVSGIGIGLFAIALSNIDIITKDFSNKNYISTTYNYPMNEDTVFLDHYYNNTITSYIEKDIPNIEVEVIHSKFFTSHINRNSNTDNIYHLSIGYTNEDLNLFKEIIHDINNHKYIDYSSFKINIYANKENLQILKNNYSKLTNEQY